MFVFACPFILLANEWQVTLLLVTISCDAFAVFLKILSKFEYLFDFFPAGCVLRSHSYVDGVLPYRSVAVLRRSSAVLGLLA